MKPCYKKLIFGLILSLIAGSMLGSGVCAQGKVKAMSYVPGEYIIHVKSGTSKTSLNTVVKQMGAELVDSIALSNSYLIKMVKNPNLTPTVKRFGALGAKPVIDNIQPNYIYHAQATPDDENWDKLWNMRLINMPAAWNIQKGSPSVTVAVLDTGVATDHPDLAARCVSGYDYIDNDATPYDLNGHGTHVAGIIAAQGDDGIGVVGVCWDGVKIMPIRILDADGDGTTDTAVKGLDYALTHGAKVVNLSFGGDDVDPALHNKIIELTNAGILVIAAAGNDGDESDPSVDYPAAYDECMAVAAVGPYDAIAYYSSYGPNNQVDIAAPGGDQFLSADALIYSTYVTYGTDNKAVIGYASEQGTSMACPHVAGGAALLLSAGIPASNVLRQMTSTARIPNSNYNVKKYGSGILDMQAALGQALIRIASPSTGASVTSRPEFRIDVKGVDLNSIEVYVDYADVDNDGVPDDIASETPVIDSTNVNLYYNRLQGIIKFTWPIGNHDTFSIGKHRVYASATSLLGDKIDDSSKFEVESKIISAGVYLFSFPYIVDTADVKPEDILSGATFTTGNVKQSRLLRWIAAPTSLSNQDIPYGYATYNPYDSNDMAWIVGEINPSSKTIVDTNGGYGYILDNLTAKRTVTKMQQAGSGYWLILDRDVPINDTLPTLDAMPNFDTAKGYTVRAYKGWNMIGNPYSHSIPWQAAIFKYKGQTKNIYQAESAGWIRPTLYAYDSTLSKEYRKVSDRDNLDAFGGYWIRSLVGNVTYPLQIVLLP